MTEYKVNNAIVRIHGTFNDDALRIATARFLKQAERQRKNKKIGETANGRKNGKEHNTRANA